MPVQHDLRQGHSPPVIPHPRLVELMQRRELRQRIEATVERLIDALDALDDPEGEPCLGASCVVVSAHFDQRRWAEGVSDDREADQGDDEPSLGAPIGTDHSQVTWARGADDDREAECHA